MKISDHHVRSPMLNVQKACQTCHHWSEDELRYRVETIQDRTFELRNLAMDALMELLDELEPQYRQDSTAANVKLAQSYQRKAQFLLDFVEAENSVGFHAPQEAARVLGNAINYARMGQIAVRGGRPGPVRPGLPPKRSGDATQQQRGAEQR